MLTLLGKRQRFCDGLSRRNFLKVGALGFCGLTLADLLRTEAAAAPSAGLSRSEKAIINIWLLGGPSHIDTLDLKPDAPPEIRGEFRPIKTTVPGMEISELMPKLAAIGEKFAIVRSLTGFQNEHDSNQTESGWPITALSSLGGHPSIGAVVSRLKGTTTRNSLPTFVDLSGYSPSGFLGPVYSGFRPNAEGLSDLQIPKIGLARFRSRNELLGKLDRIRRDIDGSRAMEALDAFNQRAVGLVTSAKMAKALAWWDKPNPKTLELYGIHQNSENGNFLSAKRLIEAGVRCVSLGWGSWDFHSNNFFGLRNESPAFDHGLSGLIRDLDASGLLENTIVVVWGEFGRSPRINSFAGRDHWPLVTSALVAGGGMRMGQVVGSTNRFAEQPQDRPIHLQEMFATFYHLLGIDPHTTTIRDPNGRPQYLVTHPDPIPELLG